MIRISKNWLQISEIYRRFAVGDHLDFSEEAAVEMYLFETRGEGNLQFGLFSNRKPNGYAVGKRYMNIAIEMWKQDIQSGLLFRWELEQDYPDWFLNKFLGKINQTWPLTKSETIRLFHERNDHERNDH